MQSRTARLQLDGPHGTVDVDGQDVSHATVGLRLDASAGMTPNLVLELRLDEVTVDGQAQVIVPEGTAAALVTLGWTPPGEQPPAGWLEAALRAPQLRRAVEAEVRRLARVDQAWGRSLGV